MSKKTVHFVYATPNTVLDKLTMKLMGRKLRHPSWEKYNWPSPLRAPLSITFQVAQHLSSRYKVKLYDLRERATIKPEKGDILLAHPWPDPQSLVWRALKDNRFAKRYIISPYNHDQAQIAWQYPAIAQCDKFFAVCGQFWIDTFEKSPFACFSDKVVRLNMGIDTNEYPLVKTDFNPPGKRKFFYIGRTGNEKGIDLLERLATDVAGFQGGYICQNGEIKGWNKISVPTDLTPELMGKIAEEYDVFINMSRADAQVTTVLEAMSWGFPVACTRESGYSEENNLFRMELDDWEHNLRTIHNIQQMENQDLELLSRCNRAHAETNYRWDVFLSTLLADM